MHEFSFSSKSWSKIQPYGSDAPSPRHSHAASVYKNGLYVFGGYDGAYKNDLHRYDFVTKNWSLVTQNGRVPSPRYRMSLSVVKDKLLCFGGHDGSRHLNDLHVFDFATLTWTRAFPDGVPPVARDSHAAVVVNNDVFLFGGSSGAARSDLHRLSGVANETYVWSVVDFKDSSPNARFCCCSVVVNDKLFVQGGYDGFHRLDDFWTVDLTDVAESINENARAIQNGLLSKTMLSLVDNPRSFPDVEFVLSSSRAISAHRGVLAARSEFFRTLFESCSFSENSNPSKSVVDLTQDEERESCFLAMLNFLYADVLDDSLSINDMMGLHLLADKYSVDDLTELCETEIIRSMKVDSAAKILENAHSRNALRLKERAMQYVVSNFDSVSKSQAFESLATSNGKLIVEILKRRS